MAKTMRILFQTLVSNFEFSIRLRMIRRTHFEFSFRHFEEFLLEMTYKDRISITNNGPWHVVQFDNSVDKEFYNNFSYIRMT